MPPSEKLPVKFRNAEEGDWNFIADSWKRSFRLSMPFVDDYNYNGLMNHRISKLRHRANWIIACQDEDSDYLMGWGCAEGPILHYVLVKNIFRGHGLALQILAYLNITQSPILISHYTPAARKINKKHPNLLRRIDL